MYLVNLVFDYCILLIVAILNFVAFIMRCERLETITNNKLNPYFIYISLCLKYASFQILNFFFNLEFLHISRVNINSAHHSLAVTIKDNPIQFNFSRLHTARGGGA